MIYDITVQVCVANVGEGQVWYELLLERRPDYIHEGFAEWELLPGCWLQVAEGTPVEGNGPVRLGVSDIDSERNRVIKELNVDAFDIEERDGVPVKWGTFSDPWGNRIGLYEHLDEADKRRAMERMLNVR